MKDKKYTIKYDKTYAKVFNNITNDVNEDKSIKVKRWEIWLYF
ncbi:MAG: hypothetical protein ABIO05_04800 [Ferruginibacter sp.]